MRIPVIFFGTPEYALPTLQALLDDTSVEVRAVVTQPDRLAGREKVFVAPPVKQLARSAGVPVLQPERIKRELPQFMAELQSIGELALGVVIAFGQILPKEVLDYPLRGCVNLHASLLPRWRGAAPIQRSIMAGDSLTGVCLMQMDEGLDTGPVYKWSETEITPNTTGGALHDALAQASADLLITNLSALFQSELKAIDQTALPLGAEAPTYAKKIESADCAIDWRQGMHSIACQVQAFTPYPGAFTIFRDKRLKIFAIEIHPHNLNYSSQPGDAVLPGNIVQVTNTELLVQCGDGIVAIKELQAEGKKRLSISEFLRGTQVMINEKLG